MRASSSSSGPVVVVVVVSGARELRGSHNLDSRGGSSDAFALLR